MAILASNIQYTAFFFLRQSAGNSEIAELYNAGYRANDVAYFPFMAYHTDLCKPQQGQHTPKYFL